MKYNLDFTLFLSDEICKRSICSESKNFEFNILKINKQKMAFDNNESRMVNFVEDDESLTILASYFFNLEFFLLNKSHFSLYTASGSTSHSKRVPLCVSRSITVWPCRTCLSMSRSTTCLPSTPGFEPVISSASRTKSMFSVHSRWSLSNLIS